jgi:hypothetical protein
MEAPELGTVALFSKAPQPSSEEPIADKVRSFEWPARCVLTVARLRLREHPIVSSRRCSTT